jgi:hypothetical protein
MARACMRVRARRCLFGVPQIDVSKLLAVAVARTIKQASLYSSTVQGGGKRRGITAADTAPVGTEERGLV